MIVGGTSRSESYYRSDYLRSAEVFNPTNGVTCSVGDMPKSRYFSRLCNGLVCGGLDDDDYTDWNWNGDNSYDDDLR